MVGLDCWVVLPGKVAAFSVSTGKRKLQDIAACRTFDGTRGPAAGSSVGSHPSPMFRQANITNSHTDISDFRKNITTVLVEMF